MGLTGGNGEDSEMSAMAQTYPSQVVSPRLLPVGPQHKRRHVPIPTTTFLIYPNFASRYAWDRLGTLVSRISECDNAWLFRHVLCVC